ncbi:ATP-binding cassette subfamily F protein 3 [Acetoanaerobium pronyense]|uniref:ATP-binding cassette subfamily F protein 3 n=1 Tax=Acetoanaerobium pronyense TaxID=1482736 RepID=A0ABS4KIX0_9FIRM|nr:ABC-F family ATP-binding cassette domain-containing protein [Acetoanaerobium pronyense]MBP2027733.1 ATP-binding cassette subfamily F protein 3 [Acetoanaerobium pronyense]
MIALAMNNIKKTFGIDTILENISFSINEGERIGLVGSNGAGKTTLFKIITGELDYDNGEIYFGKDLTIGYLAQNTEIATTNTLLEEVLTVFEGVMVLEKEIRILEHEISDAGAKEDFTLLDRLMKQYSLKTEEFTKINGYAYNSEAKGILIGLGFKEEDFSKEVRMLSGGEKTRLMLGKLLLKKPDILLLDEPTNHLDTDSVQWLESFLKQYRGTIFVISHDRYFLDELTNKTYELFSRELKIYNGNYSFYVKQRLVDEEIALKTYEENQSQIKRQQEVIDKLKAFGREKQVKRARSREKLLDKMEKVEKPNYLKKKAKITFNTKIKSGKDVMKIRSVSKSYGERTLFSEVNLDIYREEKIALIGPNGAGKSTLFNILLGEDKNFEGEITFGTNVLPVYFDQDRDDLNHEVNILDEVWSTYPHIKEADLRSMLGAFLFFGDDVFKLVGTLSGGEKARISLLKLMLSDSNFLFLDEPTNHLDIESKEVLEDALCAYEGTVFVISHDRYFLNKVPDKILVLENQEIKEYFGNYDYYMEKKAMEKAAKEFENQTEDSSTKTQLKVQRKKDKEKEKEERKLKKQLTDTENRIHAIEQQITDLDHELCKEEVYSNPEKSMEITDLKTALNNELGDLLELWEKLLEEVN